MKEPRQSRGGIESLEMDMVERRELRETQ